MVILKGKKVHFLDPTNGSKRLDVEGPCEYAGMKQQIGKVWWVVFPEIEEIEGLGLPSDRLYKLWSDMIIDIWTISHDGKAREMFKDA
ncbi:MAG: hypothetical protein AAB883_02290 [Patescibacteria group bacterium]